MRSLLGVVSVGALLLGSVQAQNGPAITDLGGAYAGAQGEPRMEAYGSLFPGSHATFKLSQALPDAPTFCVVGWSHISTPSEGTIIPSYDFSPQFQTDLDGSAVFTVQIPQNLAYGTKFYVQWLTVDAAATFGYSLSNAVQCELPSGPIDGAQYYADVINELAPQMGQGNVDDEVITWIMDHPAELVANPEILLDVLTPTDYSVLYFVTSGGPISGPSIPLRNIFGWKVGQVDVTGVGGVDGGGNSTLTGVTTSGQVPLGTSSVAQIGDTWFVDCPTPSLYHKECGIFQVTVAQTVPFSGGSWKFNEIKYDPFLMCAECP